MAPTFNEKPGDLIEIFRGPYQHWAVYIGENEVVHLDTDGQSSRPSDLLSISTGYGFHQSFTTVVGQKQIDKLLGGMNQTRECNIIGMDGKHLNYDSAMSHSLLEVLSSKTGKVKREKLADVVKGHRYQVNNLLDKKYKARDPSIIVEEACAMVGRELQYNLFTYNSKHFANEMLYGKLKGKPGDLIEIFRKDYKHWAVYIGGNEVVHFTTDGGQSSGSSANSGSSNGKVKREKFTDVVGSDRYQVNNLLDDRRKARDPSVIVKEACAMVGSELQYNVDTYNCEHFATEMRYGKAESRQFNEKPGDLIEIFRGHYQHWAVYIGENEVVHLDTDGQSSRPSDLLSISTGYGFHQSLINVVGQKQFNKLLDGMYHTRECNIIGMDGKHLNYDSATSLSLLEVLSSKTGKVKREKLADVVKGHRYQVNNLLDKKYEARDPSIIVEEACAMVGRELQYNLFTYNSKHFANEMRYGVAVSQEFNGKPGDLIEISRGLYQHWAVYIGENEVVHFTTDGGKSFASLSKSTGYVKREKLADVVGNDHYLVNNLKDKEYEARNPSIIVKEACAMVGSELQYNVVTYNCEHFATEMRYGKAESRQFNGEPGDLIEINRGPYKHWAVYTGENEVVHFTTDGGQSSGSSASLSSSTGKVKREKFTDVVGHHHYQVNNLLDKTFKARDPSVIVKEACAMVGSEPQYNVVTYNCEHFAIEMRYDKAESLQFNEKPGDLIEIFRGPYQHWAVYIGENEVVHFGTASGLSSGSSASLSSSSSTGYGFHQSLINVVGQKQVNKLLDGMNQTEYNIIGMDGYAMMRGEDLNYNSATSLSFLEVLSSITGKVKREKLADVVGNHLYQVNNLLDKKYEARDPSIIVKEACVMVGRELQYNVFTYNCEHFATEMRYGVAESQQVKKAAAIIGFSGASTASASYVLK